MTNHLARLYSAAGAIVVFFLLWATIAAHPWATTEPITPQDPRLVALAHREKKLQLRAAEVKGVVNRRWAAYEQRVSRRERLNAVALQRHLAQLEASQASAIRAAQAAVAQTAQARAYAASVVSWANQQLQRATPVSSAAPATSVLRSAPPTRTSAPAVGHTAVVAPAPAAPAPPAPPKQPASAAATAPAPAAQAATPAPAAAPAPQPQPTPAPAPAAAPPPVQVVSLPPVTTTKVSAKK